MVVGKTHDDEENGQDSKASQLKGLATDGIDSGHREPVTRDGSSEHDDQVAHGGVVEVLVSRRSSIGRVANSAKDGGVVKRKAIVRNVEEAP